MLGPVLIQFGTPEQKQRFLPRAANLDDWWCQGFSEPGAGSDLAALKTAARRDGDEYVVNGQKIWTSTAHQADWCFVPRAHQPACREKAGGHLVPAGRYEDAGHHGAADHLDRRQPSSERGVLRRRARAGVDAGRRGEQGLGRRQIPARQRAHRHRPARQVEGAGQVRQGDGREEMRERRPPADRGPGVPPPHRAARNRAEIARNHAVARAVGAEGTASGGRTR